MTFGQIVVVGTFLYGSKTQPVTAPPDLNVAMNETVRDLLRPVSAGLGTLFILLAISHIFVLDESITPLMVSLASVTAVLFLGLHFVMRRWLPPLRWVHPIGFAIAQVCLLNGALYIYLLGEPRQTTTILLLVVAAGFLLLSNRWLAATLATAWLGWGAVVWRSPPSPEWLHFGLALLIATALSVFAHTARVRTVKRLELMRLEQAAQNAKLEASLEQAEQARRLAEKLNRLGRALTSTLDLTEVLERVLENVASIVPFDRGSVMLLSGDDMEIVAARGFPPDAQPSRIRIPLRGEDNDIFRYIHLTQQPLAISDVSERPDWQYVEGLPPARSWLGVPLLRYDVVIGMLSLTRESLRPFSDGEITLVEAFAGQAALALENARLYDKMLKDYTQLERLDRNKSDFISVASHELRTPLTTLQGYSQILMGDPLIKANPYHQQLVDGLYGGAVRLHEIVDSMLDMTKIDSRTLHLHMTQLSVEMLVRRISYDVNKLLEERHQTLSVTGLGDLPAIEADLDALCKVFYHLIVNAIKYTPDGGTITISGRELAASQNQWPQGAIELIVGDTGVGIDPRFHELIFEKFYQTGEVALHSTGKSKFKGGGPGLGLAIARGITQAHGGKLWVESPGYDEKACPGSQFHLVLPLGHLAQPS